MAMPPAKDAVGSFVFFLALSSAALAQIFNRRPRSVPRVSIPPFFQFREVVCAECSNLWEKYSADCLAWASKEYRSCEIIRPRHITGDRRDFAESVECYTKRLSKDKKCLRFLFSDELRHAKKLKNSTENVIEFTKGIPQPNKDIKDLVGLEDMDEDIGKDTMSDDSSDAPIGWRTIQGEWFQKVRRRTPGYGEL